MEKKMKMKLEMGLGLEPKLEQRLELESKSKSGLASAPRGEPGRMDRDEDHGTLAQIVSNSYVFARSDYHPLSQVYDTQKKEIVPAHQYYFGRSSRMYVGEKSLPLDLDVKGAYVTTVGSLRGQPKLELSEIDYSMLIETLADSYKDGILMENSSGGMTVKTAEGQKLIKIEKQPRSIDGKRSDVSRLTFLPKYSEKEYIAKSLEVLDLIEQSKPYVQSKYAEDELKRLEGIRGGKDSRFARQEGLRQLILTERTVDSSKLKPMLKLDQQAGIEMQLGYRVSPHMVLSQQILRIPSDQLVEKVTEMVEDLDGVSYLVSEMLTKRGIARIKSLRPELSWKKAGEIYRSILSKGVKR